MIKWIFAAVAVMLTMSSAMAQTEGTLTFTFTQVPHSGSWGSKHVLAVWVQTPADGFVKTKMRYWGGGTNDHLPIWKANSGQNITDATTGATLSSYTTRTFVWDATDVSGAVVADGDYKITLEECWSHGSSKTLVSYTFTKSGDEIHLTPADNADFTSVLIDWVPVISGIETIGGSKMATIYPNPADDNLNLRFDAQTSVSRILLVNSAGLVVWQKEINSMVEGVLTIPVKDLTSGLYMVEIIDGQNQWQRHKVIIR